MMAKAGLAAGITMVAIPLLIALAVAGAVSSLFGGSGSAQAAPSPTAVADIPADYLALYQQAASTCPGLPWTILAAIGKVETDHGRSTLPGVHSGANSAGAEGVMQFEPATFATYDQPVPPGGVNPPSPYDPADAIYAAARMLCANGARNGAHINQAIFAYNHADWYVKKVLAQAQQYAASQPGPAPGGGGGDVVQCNAIHTANPATDAAINFACGQLGLPYEWGGDGPQAGDRGFDCSGLTQAAYGAAHISLPRTADTQFHAGPPVPPGQPLLAGDLVFYGTGAHIHHVGLYIGGGMMIDAPHTGADVRIEPVATFGGYMGARRYG
jgi:cell wall-associated NlpC family hydrolase